jgi:hypothetical protein
VNVKRDSQLGSKAAIWDLVHPELAMINSAFRKPRAIIQ